jgi:uncharacterized membrane protein YjdF
MENRVCQNSLVRRKDYPPLWRSLDRSKKQGNEFYNLMTLEALEQEFSVQPELRGWSLLCQDTLVVGQEFTLTCFFLCRHRLIHDAEQGLRKDGWDLQFFTLIMALFSLLLVAAFSDSQRSREKARIRFLDSILLGIFLRLMAAALKTLTASYSSDTVYALAIAGMIIHLFGCNYTYASNAVCVNDNETRQNHPLSRSPIARPPFLGGTTSLSAAFFSTTLLASRLEAVWTVHLFVTSSVTIFAFFPATRHGLFLKSPQHAPSGTC